MSLPDAQEIAQSRARRAPYGVVLCPTDLSETGNAAIDVAYQLVEDRGHVHLLFVCEPPYLGNLLYGPFVQGYVPSPEETKQGEDKVLRRLHKLVPAGAEAHAISTEFHLVHGVNVANVIEEQTRRLGADIVVLGTHGRTGLGRILLGSVATDVVRKDRLPAILVHSDEHAA